MVNFFQWINADLIVTSNDNAMCSDLMQAIIEVFDNCGLNITTYTLTDISVKGLTTTLKLVQSEARSKMLIKLNYLLLLLKFNLRM